MNYVNLDLTGQKFGKLTAIEVVYEGKRKRWRCECECGNTINVSPCNLATGNIKSCGCLSTRNREILIGQEVGKDKHIYIGEEEPIYDKDGKKVKMGRFICSYCGTEFIARFNDVTKVNRQNRLSCGCLSRKHKEGLDLTNQRFGRLIAKELVYKNNIRHWLCDCDCGTKDVLVAQCHLRSGHTKSCGCLNIETSMNNKKDLVGCKFGKLTVLRDTGERDSHKKILWDCICECGRHKITDGPKLKYGGTSTCGHCRCSTGEVLIQGILNNLGINYETQWSDNHLCINPETGRPLKFDFYLVDYNMAIEYDGEAHYMPILAWGGEKRFLNAQKRDKIKNEYCKNNNIKLIRIPYWDKNKLDESYLLKLMNSYVEE